MILAIKIAVCSAVIRVCDIHKTQLFGEFWSFTNDKALSDSAWTNDALAAHNDTTYFSIPEGIQVSLKLSDKHEQRI